MQRVARAAASSGRGCGSAGLGSSYNNVLSLPRAPDRRGFDPATPRTRAHLHLHLHLRKQPLAPARNGLQSTHLLPLGHRNESVGGAVSLAHTCWSEVRRVAASGLIPCPAYPSCNLAGRLEGDSPALRALKALPLHIKPSVHSTRARAGGQSLSQPLLQRLCVRCAPESAARTCCGSAAAATRLQSAHACGCQPAPLQRG